MGYRKTLIEKLKIKANNITKQINNSSGSSIMEKYGLIERKRQIEEDIKLIEQTIPWGD